MSAEEATEDEYFKAVNIFFSLKSSYETKIKNEVCDSFKTIFWFK